MNLATQITVLRILLTPLFVSLLLYYGPGREKLYPLSFIVFAVACLSDGVDGYLARRLDQKTALGSYLDPVADKLLLLSGFLSLSFMSHLPDAIRIPAWVTISVVTRDIIILIGSAMIFLTTGKLTAEPLFIGKVTTFCQMATLFIVLAASPEAVRIVFFMATVALTTASGIGYLRMGGRILR
ncbi:MAG: CDP-alcohol phosphatidyltransferase family protein [Candidatus Omnitrophota bacterium]